MRNCCFYTLAAFAILLSFALPAEAQWQTQVIVVPNGWTAMYLYVDPSSVIQLPSTPNVPITPDNPIDKIWLWKAPPSTAQYLNDPTVVFSGGGPWAAWGLTNSQDSLATLIPNAAYLIHSTAATNYVWNIKGQPVPPFYTWDLTGLNLVGFPTSANNPPNFYNFLAQNAALAGAAQIYEYVGGEFSTNPPANPVPVISQYYTPVTRGQAYWVSATNVNNTYFAPFQVNLPNPSGINFGAAAGQVTFHLVNLTPNPLTVSMALLPSEMPPAGQTNIVAPPPLLLEGAENLTNLTFAYTTLTTGESAISTNSASWSLLPYGQPGSDVAITLGVNRYAMNSPAGSLYAGILQFTDSLGFAEINLPVSAQAANNNGLWVGSASVNQVGYDLKTFATNADGSYQLSAVSSNVIAVTPFNLAGTTTNLFISTTFNSNSVLQNYYVTNFAVNIYSNAASSVTSRGVQITTNTLLLTVTTTNEVISSTVTNFYFDSATGDYVFESASVTNLVSMTNSQASTTLAVTNLVAPVAVSGTLEPAFNYAFATFIITNILVTNGPFMPPVTNWVVSNYTLTNATPVTDPVYNQSITNQTDQLLGVTTTMTAGNYVIQQPPVQAAPTVVTTTFFPSAPLLVLTNGGNLISLNIATNSYTYYNYTNTVNTISNLISTNFFLVTGQVTNRVGGTVPLVTAFNSTSTSGFTSTNYAFFSPIWATNPIYIYSNVVTVVSNYVVTSVNTSLDAVASPYPLRLIVFNDSSGNCSLLERVYIGMNINTNLVISTTQNALDPAQLATARRITATHLPWSPVNNPFSFSGGPLAQGATLTTTIVEPYDDQAANPFLHTYHPDHNNLNFNSNPPHELPQGSQSYGIIRTIQLTVQANTANFLSLTTANSSLSGNYSETITLAGLGANTRTYHTAGTFSLKQISTVPTLATQ